MPDKPVELWSPVDYFLSQFKVAQVLFHLFKWSKPIVNLAKNCHSARLKRAFNLDFFNRFPALFLLIAMGHLHLKNFGYPVGGSLNFAHRFAEKYLSHSVTFHYQTKATRIIARNGRAIGVSLESGESIGEVDLVISAADGHETKKHAVRPVFALPAMHDQSIEYFTGRIGPFFPENRRFSAKLIFTEIP